MLGFAELLSASFPNIRGTKHLMQKLRHSRFEVDVASNDDVQFS
jgi:hypothetical protein